MTNTALGHSHSYLSTQQKKMPTLLMVLDRTSKSHTRATSTFFIHCISSLGEKRSEFRRTRGWKRACMDPATQLMVHGILWPAKRSPWSNSEGRLVEVRGKRRKQCGSGQVDGAARTISSRRTRILKVETLDKLERAWSHSAAGTGAQQQNRP